MVASTQHLLISVNPRLSAVTHSRFNGFAKVPHGPF
jgi:hypothetical protein